MTEPLGGGGLFFFFFFFFSPTLLCDGPAGVLSFLFFLHLAPSFKYKYNLSLATVPYFGYGIDSV